MIIVARVIVRACDCPRVVDVKAERSGCAGHVELGESTVFQSVEAVIVVVCIPILSYDLAPIIYAVDDCECRASATAVKCFYFSARRAKKALLNSSVRIKIKANDHALIIHPVGLRLAVRTVRIESLERAFRLPEKAMIVVAAIPVPTAGSRRCVDRIDHSPLTGG